LRRRACTCPEPWKAPLPIFIETIYFKRFKKERPDQIRTIEEMAAALLAKKQAKRLAKQARTAARASNVPEPALREGNRNPTVI